jgi:hypothetical protein
VALKVCSPAVVCDCLPVPPWLAVGNRGAGFVEALGELDAAATAGGSTATSAPGWRCLQHAARHGSRMMVAVLAGRSDFLWAGTALAVTRWFVTVGEPWPW